MSTYLVTMFNNSKVSGVVEIPPAAKSSPEEAIETFLNNHPDCIGETMLARELGPEKVYQTRRELKVWENGSAEP